MTGKGGKILVTRCHGRGRRAGAAGWVRGAGVRERCWVRVSGRLSGGSGDALVIV